MDDTTVKSREVVLPADDGTIEQTFAELDSKLSAWHSAVAEAQDALRHATLRHAESMAADSDSSILESTCVTEEAPPAAGEAGEELAPASAISEPQSKDSEAETSVRIETSSDGEEIAADVAESSQADSLAFDVVAPAEAEQESVSIPEIGMDEAGEVAEETLPVEVGDDQALFASLDEETQAAIRVMRRLSPIQRSVRECLAEYEATQSNKSSEAASKKKSWWGRR